jgi:hypothetical protein
MNENHSSFCAITIKNNPLSFEYLFQPEALELFRNLFMELFVIHEITAIGDLNQHLLTQKPILYLQTGKMLFAIKLIVMSTRNFKCCYRRKPATSQKKPDSTSRSE